MTSPVTVRRSGVVPAPVETVFEAALSLPLPQLYRRRFGPIPPIVAVRDQDGPWETPGQDRIFTTADKGEMREELVEIDPPLRFANRLTVLKGPFRPIVERVEESWTFRAAGTVTEATWEWNLYPRARAGLPLVVVVSRFWLGYAGRVLAQLSDEVTPGRS